MNLIYVYETKYLKLKICNCNVIFCKYNFSRLFKLVQKLFSSSKK